MGQREPQANTDLIKCQPTIQSRLPVRGAQLWAEMIRLSCPCRAQSLDGAAQEDRGISQKAEVDNSLQLNRMFFPEKRSKHGISLASTAGKFLSADFLSVRRPSEPSEMFCSSLQQDPFPNYSLSLLLLSITTASTPLHAIISCQDYCSSLYWSSRTYSCAFQTVLSTTFRDIFSNTSVVKTLVAQHFS